MKTQLRFLTVALAVLALAALPQSARAVDTGSANFSQYVAMGDSLTAGFCSGSIIQTCQLNSYPSHIYEQATGNPASSFQQPLVSAPGLPGVLRLVSLSPLVIAPTPGQGQPINLNLPRPYDNVAVPGANLDDLLHKTASTSAGDPTDLILRRQGATQLQEGLSLHPTFVTLWIGNNDALRAATSGTAIEGVTLTNPAQFDAEYKAVVNAIAGTGAKMAVATIPDVTSIPFVTTLPRFILNPQTGQPVIVGGAPVSLIGVNQGDYVLLTAQGAEQQGFGIPVALGGNGQPLPGSVVLTAAEATTIRNYVNTYNASIMAAASAVGAAVVDANAIFSQVAQTGLDIGGVTFTSAFLTGGLFSYDGVHPTNFGYAYVANLFIDAINQKFGGDIPPVDLYPYMFGGKSLNASGAGMSPGPFYFSPLAWDNLRASLNIPSQQQIDQALHGRKPRHGHH